MTIAISTFYILTNISHKTSGHCQLHVFSVFLPDKQNGTVWTICDYKSLPCVKSHLGRNSLTKLPFWEFPGRVGRCEFSGVSSLPMKSPKTTIFPLRSLTSFRYRHRLLLHGLILTFCYPPEDERMSREKGTTFKKNRIVFQQSHFSGDMLGNRIIYSSLMVWLPLLCLRHETTNVGTCNA